MGSGFFLGTSSPTTVYLRMGKERSKKGVVGTREKEEGNYEMIIRSMIFNFIM